MPLSINTNIASMSAQRSFLNSSAQLETAFERLASGKRVNSAVDDAAGLAIGKEMEARVSGLNQAIRNVNDGISMVQIAEGALDEVTTILQKMRDLSVQASSDGLSSDERAYIDVEHAKLASSMDAVLLQAKFNGTTLIGNGVLNGGVATSLSIQAGATTASEDTITIGIDNLSASILSVDAGSVHTKHNTFVFDTSSMDLTTAITGQTSGNGSAVSLTLNSNNIDGLVSALNASEDSELSKFTYKKTGVAEITAVADTAGAAIGGTTFALVDAASSPVTSTGTRTAGAATADYGLAAIDTAMGLVAEDRANLGALQSQLESTVRNLANVAENTAAAADRIMDTDYAAETANLTKAQILQQAATSVLAQANAQPQAVLSLLQ